MQPASATDYTALLDQLHPGLTAAALQDTARTQEHINTVRFAFNPWTPIPNVSLSGFGFGIQHVVLKRMELIPLKTWKVPDIKPRTSPFALGITPTGGVFPAGSVGSTIEHVLQFPLTSARLLTEHFGNAGANNIGVVELSSLMAVEDRDKFEAVLLYEAVMKTPLEDGDLSGVDVCLEDLPKFLASHAPKLLERVATNGIRGYKLAQWRGRGEVMIEHLRQAVAAATKFALDPTQGVLPKTKQSLIAASKGINDSKAIPDKLDQWLLGQFPSFSLDTDVERAARANAGVTEAIRASGAQNAQSTAELIDMFRDTLKQLSEERAINRQLLEKIASAAQ